MMFWLDLPLRYIQEGIACIGVMVIVAGSLRGIYHLIALFASNRFSTNYIRLQFGDSVILGLEFMVGADIVGSLIQPDYYNIGLLAILVIIRTVLSYFLNLELSKLSPQEQKNIASQPR